jgi:hypothetical protein
VKGSRQTSFLNRLWWLVDEKEKIRQLPNHLLLLCLCDDDCFYGNTLTTVTKINVRLIVLIYHVYNDLDAKGSLHLL